MWDFSHGDSGYWDKRCPERYGRFLGGSQVDRKRQDSFDGVPVPTHLARRPQLLQVLQYKRAVSLIAACLLRSKKLQDAAIIWLRVSLPSLAFCRAVLINVAAQDDHCRGRFRPATWRKNAVEGIPRSHGTCGLTIHPDWTKYRSAMLKAVHVLLHGPVKARG